MHIYKNYYSTILTFIIGITLFCTKNEQITGTVDDSDTGISVFLPDSSPAIDAVIKFIPSTRSQTPGLTKKYSAPSAVTVVRTDSSGKFLVPALADSTYNIFIEKGDLKAFQSEVTITSQGHTIQNDTLNRTGSFSAIVGLDPKDMHNVGAVAIQILGSDIQYINPDKNGSFTFKDIAAGNYKLRLETNLPEYSPTFFTMTIESANDSIYPDTIFMKYTGIPSVLGLSAAFDTSSGIVHLSWHPTEYSNILDYVIFRDAEPTVTYSTAPYKAISDTSLVDTIFDIHKTPIDTQQLGFKYRVAIRNNSTVIGNTYGAASVTATPYKSVLPKIDSIKVAFDTLSGTANISWLSIPPIDSNYDYLLIRNSKHALSGWSEDIRATGTTDTIGHMPTPFYSDSLYGKTFSFGDSSTFYITYTVSIFKKEWKLSGRESISTPLIITPYKARVPQITRMSISFDTLQGVASVTWDSASAAASVSGYRVIRTLARQLQPQKVDTFPLLSGNVLLDTIFPKLVSFNQTDPVIISYTISAYHQDWKIHGMVTIKTETVYSYKAFPPKNFAGTDQTVDISSDVLLVGTVMTATYPAAKKEWKIGDGDWVTAGDSVQFTTNSEHTREIIPCIFRVTDSIGNVAADTMVVTKTPLVVTLSKFPSRQGTLVIEKINSTKEFLHLGEIDNGRYGVWSTNDLNNYTLLSANTGITNWGNFFTFKNNYYIYNNTHSGAYNPSYKSYKSSDAISWSEIVPTPVIQGTATVSLIATQPIPLKNSMIFINTRGTLINSRLIYGNILYRTNDGINWDSIGGNIPQEYCNALFKIGDTLCLFTETNKYRSSDGGITWNFDKFWDADGDVFPDVFYGFAYSDSVTVVAYQERPSLIKRMSMNKNGTWKILPTDILNIEPGNQGGLSVVGNRCVVANSSIVRSFKLY